MIYKEITTPTQPLESISIKREKMLKLEKGTQPCTLYTRQMVSYFSLCFIYFLAQN